MDNLKDIELEIDNLKDFYFKNINSLYVKINILKEENKLLNEIVNENENFKKFVDIQKQYYEIKKDNENLKDYNERLKYNEDGLLERIVSNDRYISKLTKELYELKDYKIKSSTFKIINEENNKLKIENSNLKYQIELLDKFINNQKSNLNFEEYKELYNIC